MVAGAGGDAVHSTRLPCVLASHGPDDFGTIFESESRQTNKDMITVSQSGWLCDEMSFGR